MIHWTSFEEQRLRELVEQGLSHREIGKLLTRTAKAINSRCKYLKLGKDRSWTEEQTAILREHYSSKSGAELQVMLQRPLSSIYQKARKLGMPRKWESLPANTRERVKALHSQKMTDAEIAKELGIDRRYVNELRTLMGLPLHQDRLLEAKRKGYQKQLNRLGIKNRAELRYRYHRKYARDHGLPEQLRFRAVQVAYCLARHGPSTRPQICERLGLTWTSSRKNGLCANGNWVKNRKRDQKATYLSELMEEGIVVKIPRILQTGRQGGNLSIYDLTPEWRERITSHVQQRQAIPDSDARSA